jgi:hypothetical protein
VKVPILGAFYVGSEVEKCTGFEPFGIGFGTSEREKLSIVCLILVIHTARQHIMERYQCGIVTVAHQNRQ